MNDKTKYSKTVSLTAIKLRERRERGWEWREMVRVRGGETKMRLLRYVF